MAVSTSPEIELMAVPTQTDPIIDANVAPIVLVQGRLASEPAANTSVNQQAISAASATVQSSVQQPSPQSPSQSWQTVLRCRCWTMIKNLAIITSIVAAVWAFGTGAMLLKLARWTAQNDYLQACIAHHGLNGDQGSPCNDTLLTGPIPPPNRKRDNAHLTPPSDMVGGITMVEILIWTLDILLFGLIFSPHQMPLSLRNILDETIEKLQHHPRKALISFWMVSVYTTNKVVSMFPIIIFGLIYCHLVGFPTLPPRRRARDPYISMVRTEPLSNPVNAFPANIDEDDYRVTVKLGNSSAYELCETCRTRISVRREPAVEATSSYESSGTTGVNNQPALDLKLYAHDSLRVNSKNDDKIRETHHTRVSDGWKATVRANPSLDNSSTPDVSSELDLDLELDSENSFQVSTNSKDPFHSNSSLQARLSFSNVPSTTRQIRKVSKSRHNKTTDIQMWLASQDLDNYGRGSESDNHGYNKGSQIPKPDSYGEKVVKHAFRPYLRTKPVNPAESGSGIGSFRTVVRPPLLRRNAVWFRKREMHGGTIESPFWAS